MLLNNIGQLFVLTCGPYFFSFLVPHLLISLSLYTAPFICYGSGSDFPVALFEHFDPLIMGNIASLNHFAGLESSYAIISSQHKLLSCQQFLKLR
jgi:hypothetical protein